jgi:hypothetical protein
MFVAFLCFFIVCYGKVNRACVIDVCAFLATKNKLAHECILAKERGERDAFLSRHLYQKRRREIDDTD